MSNDIPLTIVGNLTADPVIREHNGKRFGSITVASTPRFYNREANSWQDGEATFMPVNLQDHHIRALEAARVGKGSGLMVTGVLKTRKWQDRESGKDRSRMELTAEHVGQWLLPPRGSGGGQQGGGMRPGTAGDAPWGQQGGQQGNDGWYQQPGGDQGTYDDETPF